ncbi:FAD-dependent monooxygenase [Streptacidiphilus neutrinimicus]|uniref:FAD-dependent monooxygenase n=1 Tax=Streptacidiphilus neutrinimicus TaxID=105420 RepID=UPI0005A77308|nr:FAD-dependent monooxygenase [Streptacidiphilus neutrinimicus]
MTDVIVAGAGPTGMMLAGELALAGVDVRVVERRATAELLGMRARGFHSRTIEILDQRGIADRFLAEGQTVSAASFANARVDVGDLPTRHPYTLGLVQSRVEEILAGWIEELGVPVLRGREVVGFAQDADGVELRLADGAPMRARYLVAADGGRSTIRKAAGIGFPGWEATRSTLIAEVEATEETPKGMRVDATGIHGLTLMADGRTTQVLVTEQQLGPATEPTLADLSNALIAVYGTDFGVHSPTTISRFSDATRQADAYRAGRVLLAGDAAHVHGPTGGQGIGLGVEDAVNLGWKLAQVVRGVAPDSLLDTYQAERHPATARVLKYTMAMSVTQRADPRVDALADVVADLMSVDAARTRMAALHLGLDVRYGAEGVGHPLLGRRMPDLDLTTAQGPLRMFTLLHEARPVLLGLGEPGSVTAGAWRDRVRSVDARYEGAWELPVLGPVPAPAAVLVRPDGHVAWVGDGTDAGLDEALARWFGPAPAPQA